MSLRDLKCYSICLQHITSESYVCTHFISGFFLPSFLFLCINRAGAEGNSNSLLSNEKPMKKIPKLKTKPKPQETTKVGALTQVRESRFLLNCNWAKRTKMSGKYEYPAGRWRSGIPNGIVPRSLLFAQLAACQVLLLTFRSS